MKKQIYKVRLHSDNADISATFHSREDTYDFLMNLSTHYKNTSATLTINGDVAAEGLLDKDFINIAEGVVTEDGVSFTDKDFFRDEEEHFYMCECHNGYAECVSKEMNDKRNPHLKIKVTYPLMEDIMKDDEKVAAVREYRGLLEDDEITFADIMVKFGKIVKREIYWVDDLLYWFDVDMLCIEKLDIEYNGRKITHLEMDDDGILWYWSGEPKGKDSSKMCGNAFYGLNEDILKCF